MNYNNTIEILQNDLRELDELINSFKGKEKIPQIEIDIAMNKMGAIYDLLSLIKRTENSEPTIVTSSEILEEKNEVVKDELKDAEIPINEKKGIVEEEIQPISFEETVKEENEELTEDTSSEKTIDVQVDGQKEILADRFQGRNNSINETLSKNNAQKDVASKMASKPLDNINSGIGINDRFIYQKELFKNNKELYKNTIDVLNNAENFDAAKGFIFNNFNWDLENPVTQKFLELVKRKHLKNNINQT